MKKIEIKFLVSSSLLTLPFLFIVFFESCKSSKGDVLKEYSTNNYTIKYPGSWGIDTSDAPRVAFTLYSPKENIIDDFSENVNLMIQDLKGQNMGLDKYAEISETQIKANAVDLHGFRSRKTKTNKREFYQVEYKMTFNDFKLHTKQYYFIENEKAIVLTFTSERDKPKEEAIGDKILKSFSYHDK